MIENIGESLLFGISDSVVFMAELYVLFSLSTVSSSVTLMVCKKGPSKVATVSAFPQLECWSRRWMNLFPFAIAASAVWALLYLLFLGHVVRSTAFSRRMSGGVSKGSLAFMTKQFQDTTYFWIIITSIEDLLFVIVSALVSDCTGQLILCGM